MTKHLPPVTRLCDQGQLAQVSEMEGLMLASERSLQEMQLRHAELLRRLNDQMISERADLVAEYRVRMEHLTASLVSSVGVEVSNHVVAGVDASYLSTGVAFLVRRGEEDGRPLIGSGSLDRVLSDNNVLQEALDMGMRHAMFDASAVPFEDDVED